MLAPKDLYRSVAFLTIAGFKIRVVADFRALAPSAAPTPASRMETIRTVICSAVTPNCARPDAARGVASAMSCKPREVAFSTAFMKSNVRVKSSEVLMVSLKAVCRAIVISVDCSTFRSPRAAIRDTASVLLYNSSPFRPVAARRCSISKVFSTD